MEKTPISVSESIALINQTLDYAYPTLIVEGEISSFKINRDKYVFFDLKDDEASIACFMTVWQLRMPLEDGMKVQIVAKPRLTNWGKFSLTVREVRPIGEGSLKRSFELLKANLEKEGLFAPDNKRPLPSLPHRIGLIASAESAGYVDFLTILGARWGGMEIEVANVQVQGVGAAEQLVRAIKYFNGSLDPPELLVIVRGGGSADDLAVFNDEPLVRAVAGSKIPTLAGIGHEIDTSLVDLAADARAATPSNAAERLTPDRREIMQNLARISERISDRIVRRIEITIQELHAVGATFEREIKARLSGTKDHIVAQKRLLDQLSPVAALRRGYAILKDQEGTLVSSKNTIITGDNLIVESARYILKVGVQHATKKQP